MTIWTTITKDGYRSIDTNNCSAFDILCEWAMDINDANKKKKSKLGKIDGKK